jgi:hypothetical protein
MVAMQFASLAAFAQTMEPPPGPNPQGSQDPEGKAAKTEPTVPNPYLDAMGFVPQSNQSAEINVHGQAGTRIDGIQKNVDDIIRRDNPYGRNEKLSTLIFQGTEQANYMAQSDVNNLIDESLGSINDTYSGLHQWFKDDLVGNLFGNIGQLIGKWVSELINGWMADTVDFLAGFLRVFVLNPNIAVNGLNNSQDDGISPLVRQAADVMYGIAVDLLLLLFILAIWKYWIEAAWRGAGNLMGAVGRLIFTAGLMLAWPTLYAFEVQITNEMIKAIYFNTFREVMMLDAALASAVRGGILAGNGGLTNAFAPLLGGMGVAGVGKTIGEVFAFAGLVIFLILGGILIAELIYILVLKAIQTALLTAQYMFAPIFLVFYATPSTESVATGFVRAFVETSLWTFVWVGLLKIMVIIMFSNFNPWGKILISIGVLQMMIQVPTFLARAQISPMSDFISAGLITGGLFKMLGWMGKTASDKTGQLFDYHMNQKYGARGTKGTTNNEMNSLPHESSRPDMVNSLKGVSKTERDRLRQQGKVPPGGQSLKTGQQAPGTPPGTPPGSPSGLKNTLNQAQKPGVGLAAGAAAAAAALAAKKTGATGAAVNPTATPGLNTAGMPGLQLPGKPPLGLKDGQEVTDLATGNKLQRVDGKNGQEGFTKTTMPDGTEIYDFDNGERAVKAPGTGVAGQVPPVPPPGTNPTPLGAGIGGRQPQARTTVHQSGTQTSNAQGQPRNMAQMPGRPPQGLKDGQEITDQATGNKVLRVDGKNGAEGYTRTTTPDGTEVYDFDNGQRAVKVPGTGTPGQVPPVPPSGSNPTPTGKAGQTVTQVSGAQAPGVAGPGNTASLPGRPPTGLQNGQEVVDPNTGIKYRRVDGLNGQQGYTQTTLADGTEVFDYDNGQRGIRPSGTAITPGLAPPPPTTRTPPPGAPVRQPAVSTATVAASAAAVGALAAAMPPPPSGILNGQEVMDPNTGVRYKRADGIMGGYTQTTLTDGTEVYDYDNGQRGVRLSGTAVAAGQAPPPPTMQTPTVPARVAAAPVHAAPVYAAPVYAAAASAPAAAQAGYVVTGGYQQPSNPGAAAAAYALGQMDPDYGGGSGQLPLEEQYQMPISTPRGWNEPNLFAVPYRKIIGQLRKVDGVGIHFDQNATGVMGDARNGATRINIGRGATESEMAHGIMAASYAQEATNDVVGADAARQAAIDGGADRPQGLFESLAANWYSNTGSSFKQTVRAKERFAQQRYTAAAAGSAAYVSGQQGNAFTQYLRGKYGDWDDKMDVMATAMLTDPEMSESPWNTAIGPATDALVSGGIPICAQTRGAMQNPAVMAMHPSRRKLAVPALLRYTFPEAKAHYGHMDPTVFAQAHAEMARALPQSEVEAAVALDTASGGQDTSPTFATPVMQLAAETGMDVPKCHAAMSAILPYAAQSTGRLRMGANPRNISTMRDLYYNLEPLQGESHQEAFATLSVGTVQGMKVANASGLDAKLFLNEDTASAAMGFLGNDLHDVYSPAAQGKFAVMRTVINDRNSPSNTSTLNAVFEHVNQGGALERMDSVHIRAISNLHAAGGTRAVAPHVVEYAIATGNTDPNPGDINSMIRQAEPYRTGQVTDMRSAVHVGRLSDIGIAPTRQTINFAIENAAMHGGDRIDAQEMRAIIRIGEGCRNPSTAPKVFEVFARDLASDSGVANADSLPVGQLMGELQRHVPNYASRIEHTAVNVQRAGRFSDSQMGDKGVVNLAVEAVQQSGTSGYTLPAINVAARLIGAENIQSINDAPIQVIEEFLDNGGSMDRMTLGDLNAGVALYEARQVAIQEAAAASNYQAVAQCEMVRLTPRNLGTVQQSASFSARGAGPAHLDLNDAAQRAVWDRLVQMSMPRPPGAGGMGGGGHP